jgi:N-acetyl sugar amidotransferase
MDRCRLCIMPPTRPDTAFVDGVCSACISYLNRPQIDWDTRKKELMQLLDRHHGRVVVPSSGGKDSTYIALKMVELGADVTIVTATTCQLTEIGRYNIHNLARFARTIEVSPNRSVRANLNRLGLELVGDISWPEHASIFSVPFRVARDMEHTLIMFGESPQREYGGPVGSEDAKQMTKRWTTEFGGFLGLRPFDFVGMEGITERDMLDYQFPDDIGNVEAHFLGQYIPWNSHHNAEIAISNGMKYSRPTVGNWWEWENLDNLQTGIHDYFGFLKYGYGRMCAQLSVDIRYGLITREAAMDLCAQFDGTFPKQYMGQPIDDVLHHVGMGRKRFLDLCERFTNRSIISNEYSAMIREMFLRQSDVSIH